MPRRLVWICACSAAITVGACGGDDASPTTSSTAPESTAMTSATAVGGGPVAIGTLGATVTPSTAGEPGLVVQSVENETRARLRVGDVIVSLNDKPIDDPDAVIEELADPEIGDTFTIEVVRGDKRFTLTEVAAPTAYVGVKIKNGPDGVVVLELAPGGPAEGAGIKVDDVILAIGDTKTPNADNVPHALAKYSPGDEVAITVSRDGEQLELDATLAEQP